jgi:hypothetical protein
MPIFASTAKTATATLHGLLTQTHRVAQLFIGFPPYQLKQFHPYFGEQRAIITFEHRETGHHFFYVHGQSDLLRTHCLTRQQIRVQFLMKNPLSNSTADSEGFLPIVMEFVSASIPCSAYDST